MSNMYLLIVMCLITRYPAVYPLHTITTESVVKLFSQFVSIFANPKVFQSDQGTNVTPNMFAAVLVRLHIKHARLTPYHPESQGALKWFHQTLKSLLKVYCTKLG